MKKLLLVMGLMLACQLSAYADPEQPIGNDPVGFYDKLVLLVEKADPRAGAVYNFESGEWTASTEAVIFEKAIKGYEFDVVGGYSINKLVYGAVETDFLAAVSKLTGAHLAIPWVELNAGAGCGYSWDSEDFAYLASVNVSKKW